MVITVKDYYEIRKRHENGESQRHIAKALGISRNTVRKYCEGNAVPWERKTPVRTSAVMTEDVISFIRSCLDEDDQENLKKQHHTAKRIYDRLVEEYGFTGGESTVRLKVQEMKGEQKKAFIPLEFDAAEALQVDWGEATVYLAGEKTTVNIFCARLCYSCRPFVLAYHRQNEESFLDAFVRIFEQMGGVPRKVIFDNAKIAVKDGFGAQAKKQKGYTALTAHYCFDALFCNPAEGHEKGLVEGLVGWSRRNILVPVPHVASINELNVRLTERCKRYETHRIRGKQNKVGEMYAEERQALRALPGYRFETAKCIDARVNAFSLVRFKRNSYSVPVRFSGRTVGVKGYPEHIEIYCDGEKIAEHSRCFGKEQKRFQLGHYMPLLEQRKRAILNAAPVRQNLPPEVLSKIRSSEGDYSGMVKILKEFTQATEPSIKDPVLIQSVDLTQYDHLSIRTGGDLK